LTGAGDAVALLRSRAGGVFATVVMTGCGFGMLQLALPLYLHSTRASETAIGVTLAMFGVGMFAFEFIWGWLSDHVGLPVLLIGSYAMFSLASLGFAVARGIPEFAVLCFISAGMMVAAAPLVRGFVGVSLPMHQRGMANGFLQAGWSLGLAVGAALAGFLGDHLGLATVFQVIFVFPLAAAALGLIIFRANYRMKLASIPLHPGDVVSRRSFAYRWPLIVTSGVILLTLVGFGGEAAFVPLLVTTHLGLSSTSAGVAMSTLGLATALLMVPFGRLSDRLGRRPLILIGTVFSVMGLIGYAVAGSFFALIAAVLARALGNALTWPAATALLADSVPRSRQGVAMGIYGEFENVGETIGPVMAGSIWASAGPGPAFLALAAVVGLAGFTALRIDEKGWRRRALVTD
jgi:MFS family permease